MAQDIQSVTAAEIRPTGTLVHLRPNAIKPSSSNSLPLFDQPQYENSEA